MTVTLHQACLLLGSNIESRKNLISAVKQLRQKMTILQTSSVWETPPVGSTGPNFLNLALLITTSLEVDDLKKRLLRPLEAQLGRVRGADKNAPRPIDIDIILFDGRLLDPSLWRYAHRAVPVAELLPDYRSARGEILRNVAFRLAKETPIRLKPDLVIDRRINLPQLVEENTPRRSDAA